MMMICICLLEDFFNKDNKKRKSKQAPAGKGQQELKNLQSLINYDRRGNNREKGALVVNYCNFYFTYWVVGSGCCP